MADNLFTMLSAYRQGSAATPFENYCTTALAYFLKRGHRMLSALIAQAAGTGAEDLVLVEVQPRLAEAGVADLLLTYEGGKRVLIEVQVEPNADQSLLPGFEAIANEWIEKPAFLILGLGNATPDPWRSITWAEVLEAVEDDPDPVASEFREFVLQDVLGLGDVPLEEALSTNRLYALGGAAIRRFLGNDAHYVNSASRPLNGQYRYLGTTFSIDGAEMNYWIGIVNETVPLGEHYHLMLASKEKPLLFEAVQPRATGDWKWPYWTGMGRVVRPITPASYEGLLERTKRK
ncbi:MAG: hypothetical protein ABI577_05100 [bacterium]